MVVVDASVGYKWFSSEEEHSSKALGILDAHILKKQIVTVPDLIIYELANVWSTKTNLPTSKAQANLNDLEESSLQVEVINFDLIRKSINLAKKYKISTYDATYVALAQENNCDLITADSKLVSQINLPFVKNLADYSVD